VAKLTSLDDWIDWVSGCPFCGRYWAQSGHTLFDPKQTSSPSCAPVLAAKVSPGASPAETPIETPIRFEFVLNLKTAKSLGIAIPASTLLRADEAAP
jgi:putative ABC transport system substrate-binding protein